MITIMDPVIFLSTAFIIWDRLLIMTYYYHNKTTGMTKQANSSRRVLAPFLCYIVIECQVGCCERRVLRDEL